MTTTTKIKRKIEINDEKHLSKILVGFIQRRQLHGTK